MTHQDRQNSPTSANQGVTRSLKEVLGALKARYRVEILFEDKVIEGYSLPAGNLPVTGNIESLLERAIQPFNLRYKRVKEGTYLIMARKVSRKTAILPPNSRLAENTTSTADAVLAQPVPAVTDRPATETVEPAKPQEIPVRGRITDSEKGEALPGVSVAVKGQSRGTTTNANVFFGLAKRPWSSEKYL